MYIAKYLSKTDFGLIAGSLNKVKCQLYEDKTTTKDENEDQ